MVKKEFKFWVEQKDYKKLLDKARELGFTGKGALSHFFEYIANQPMIIVDENIKTALRAIRL